MSVSPVSDRRAAIVETAVRLLESEGAAALTMRRLADEMGFTPPILYDHFEGKHGLLAGIADHGFGILHAALVDDAPPGRRFEAALQRYVEFGLTHPALYDVMHGAPGDAIHTSPNAQAAYAALSAVIAAVGHGDTEVRAKLTWAGLHGIVSLVRAGAIEPEWHERLVGEFATALLDAWSDG